MDEFIIYVYSPIHVDNLIDKKKDLWRYLQSCKRQREPETCNHVVIVESSITSNTEICSVSLLKRHSDVEHVTVRYKGLVWSHQPRTRYDGSCVRRWDTHREISHSWNDAAFLDIIVSVYREMQLRWWHDWSEFASRLKSSHRSSPWT